MSFNIGKKMTAFPPHAMVEQGSGPFLTGGIPKVGSTLTAITGIWRGLGSLNPRFQWNIGGSTLLNATNASFSIQSATASSLGCRMSFGNATWGTWWKEVGTGTLAP